LFQAAAVEEGAAIGTQKLAQYLSLEGAQAQLAAMAAEVGTDAFVQVRNLDYIPNSFELYPLAPASALPLPGIAAFAVDMDGTSTTTEPLALHSLEYMVRRFTNQLTVEQWPGLDPVHDHPYVIGNSNFRHTEFLVERYRDRLDHDAFCQAYFEAVAWTLACMEDPQRRRDIVLNARNVGLAALVEDRSLVTLTRTAGLDDTTVAELVKPLVAKHGAAFRYEHLSELVSAALDIYYYRYHAIMRKMEAGDSAALAQQLLGDSGRRLVEPMPGYEVFIPLIKGWLGADADAVFEPLVGQLRATGPDQAETLDVDAARQRFGQLARHFAMQPAKVALVTASIAYEAHACMREVIRVMAELVQDWPVAAATRETLAAELSDYRRVFDGFVCATDACEPRLKPHRDLYSLALFQMSISKAQYGRCVGIEDTEPGIIALRAAGIGCAVALPNHDTSRQDYSAATHIAPGGLPQLLLADNLLLDPAVLTAEAAG
jgi:HAD superfamily hydrolase (TIGR01509 family)